MLLHVIYRRNWHRRNYKPNYVWFCKKNQLCVLFTKVSWHFPPSMYASLCRVSVCRLQQSIQTAQGRYTVIAFEWRARPKSCHVLKDTFLNVQSSYSSVFAFNLKIDKILTRHTWKIYEYYVNSLYSQLICLKSKLCFSKGFSLTVKHVQSSLLLSVCSLAHVAEPSLAPLYPPTLRTTTRNRKT